MSAARRPARAPRGDGWLNRLGGAEPDGYRWRGLEFSPPPKSEGERGMWSTVPISLGEDGRAADWKFHKPKSVWHARLRIGADRYPGVGTTPAEALAMAEAEATSMATFIVAMLPEQSSPAPASKPSRRAGRKG